MYNKKEWASRLLPVLCNVLSKCIYMKYSCVDIDVFLKRTHGFDQDTSRAFQCEFVSP